LNNRWGLKISLSVLAAGAIRRMVDAGLARWVARRADPVGWTAISNSSSRADLVASSIVHVEAISAVVADEVLSALKASFRASSADWSKSSESVVALSLTDISLEDKWIDTLGAGSSRCAGLASSSTRNTVALGINEVSCWADALVINGLGERGHASSAGAGINTDIAVRSASSAVSNTVGWDSEEGPLWAWADSVSTGSCQGNTSSTVGGWWADSASISTRNTFVAGIGIEAVHTNANAFGELDDSVLGGKTLNAKFKSLLALRAERIGVTVGLDTWSISSGEVTWKTDAGRSSETVNSEKSVSWGIASKAGSWGNWASLAFFAAGSANSGLVLEIELIETVHAGAHTGRGEVSGGSSWAWSAWWSIGAGMASGVASCAVNGSGIKESSNAFTVLGDVSADGVDAWSAGSVGGAAGLALIGALLAGSSIDEVSSSTSAGVTDSKNGSSDTGGALFGSGGIADWAVEGRAFVALEGLGGVKIESWKTGASSLTGVEEESSLSIASNTGGWSNGGIKTSVGGAASNTASSAGVIGLEVLRKSNVGVETLIDSSASNERDSDHNIGNSWVDVDSLEDLMNSVVCFSSNGIDKDLSISNWGGNS
jgi:hypothetical protein